MKVIAALDHAVCAGLILGILGPCWTYAEHARLMLGVWTHAGFMLSMLRVC